MQLLTPLQLLAGARRRFLRWLARELASFLAHTPIISGDKNRVRIGSNVHLSDAILNCRSGNITIEDDVFFGHHCLVLTGTHDFTLKGQDRVTTVPSDGRDIVIRRGAWIASQVTLIGPCEVGEHAVVVTGTIVRENVAPGVIYGGMPPRVIKEIDFQN